jgi:expansin (peptidoglycan-binding protein)
MTYQNIRNLNKNVATVECDLGEHTSDVGFVYLDKVFTTTDTVTGNLSYTGKKFIMNRVSQNAYVNELNSVQLIEVSVGEIEAFIIPNYITDAGQLGPFWLAQFNINIV